MIIRPNRSKPLLLIIIVLFLANIAGWVFFLKRNERGDNQRPPMDRKEMIAGFLKKDLKFSGDQLRRYDSLSEEHKKWSEPLFDDLRLEKEKRLQYLVENNYTDTALQQAVNRSAERQKRLDLAMLRHIRDIRALCDPAQLRSFDSGFYKMFRRNRPDKKANKATN